MTEKQIVWYILLTEVKIDSDTQSVTSLSVAHSLFTPENTLNRIADMIVENRVEISSLTIQRDELLPLLMNGQVSVLPTEVNCDLSELGR